MVDLVPDVTGLYLWGDKLSASEQIDKFRKGLRFPRKTKLWKFFSVVGVLTNHFLFLAVCIRVRDCSGNPFLCLAFLRCKKDWSEKPDRALWRGNPQIFLLLLNLLLICLSQEQPNALWLTEKYLTFFIPVPVRSARLLCLLNSISRKFIGISAEWLKTTMMRMM